MNFDPEAEPLEKHLGIIPEHFKDWRHEEKTKVVHVGKIMNMNWKVGLEAFIESYHVIATHSQAMPAIADANTQYDNYEGSNYNRMLTVMGRPSPHLEVPPTEQEIFDNMTMEETRVFEGAADGVVVPEGLSARDVLADISKENILAYSGVDVSSSSNSELLDAIQYFVFPNMFPWGGHMANIVYRFRPYHNDPNWCLMEVMILNYAPAGVPKPEPASLRLLDHDEAWADAPELGGLGMVFDQDAANMEQVQLGLKRSVSGVIQLGNYQESRVRDVHRMIDQHIAALENN